MSLALNKTNQESIGRQIMFFLPIAQFKENKKMMATQLVKSNLVTGNTPELNTAIAPISQTRNNRLVARWLTDENSKLYCQWMIED